MDVLFDAAFAEAQIVRNLFIGFGFGNESHYLPFAAREGVSCLVARAAFFRATCRTGVPLAAGMKAVPAARTTSAYGGVCKGNCNAFLLHNYWCKTKAEFSAFLFCARRICEAALAGHAAAPLRRLQHARLRIPRGGRRPI
jgi:hypothetical protein